MRSLDIVKIGSSTVSVFVHRNTLVNSLSTLSTTLIFYFSLRINLSTGSTAFMSTTSVDDIHLTSNSWDTEMD